MSIAGGSISSHTVLATGASLRSQCRGSTFRRRLCRTACECLSAVDRSSPTVAIQVWYHVGSKDDPAGRSGFAHLFEHIMFKATKNMKSEMMDRLTEDVGGFNNAFTNPDVTVYYEVVPSHYLETLLWAEADRLSGLTVDDPNFKSERSVVQEEYRQSYLAPPYGMLYYLIEQQSFTRTSLQDDRPLAALKISTQRRSKTCARFTQPFIVRTMPRSSLLATSIRSSLMRGLRNTWRRFLNRQCRSRASPTVEPERKAERRIVHHAANVPLPAIALTYLIPSEKSPDSEALQVAATILSQGESSRLYRSLIYEQQVAQSADAAADLREDVEHVLFQCGARERQKT